MALSWIYCMEHLQVSHISKLLPNPEMEDFYPLVNHMVVDKCTPISVPDKCMDYSHNYIHGLPTKSYSL